MLTRYAIKLQSLVLVRCHQRFHLQVSHNANVAVEECRVPASETFALVSSWFIEYEKDSVDHIIIL
jgi:hypothetical protein